MSVKRIDVYTIYLTHVLGKGSFGNVYRGINQQTNQPVAVKVIPRYAIDHDEYLKASLTNQIKILQSVKSEYIVGFYDVMESPKNYYIIEELCDGDLSKIIRQGQNLPQSYCIDILTQICEGFIALVKEGIIHRDLKPANILRRGNVFKIGDFGFSKQLNIPKNVPDKIQKVQELKMKTSVGTPLYMSIQILKSIQYTSKCDIWALGFIFYEMLHGKTPWTAQRQFQLVTNIETQSLKIQRQDLSQHTVDFLKRCLQVYQKDRISWNQIFTHPIFQSKFLAFADQNKEFQNKMKGIMTRLRFYFHLNKNYLEEYLNKNGFKNTNEELSFESYYEFLRVVHPTINQQEAMYIFKKTDIDGNGSISLDQILVMLKKYGIALQQTQLDRPEISFNRTLSHRNESQKKIAQQKIEQCFKKLYKIIIKNSLTLQRVFSDFDKAKKGYLTLKQFKNMVQKLSKDITDQDAKLAFQMMDDDDSGSLEYSEINKHFKEINSIDQNSNI